MVMVGGPWTGGFGGQTATQANAAAGLPFAGVPAELRDAAEKILEREPTHPDPVIDDHQPGEASEVSFRTLLRSERKRVVGATALVVVETLAALSGPALTGLAIDRGVREDRFDVVMAIVGIYTVAVLVNAVASSIRISLTGRITESILERLRRQMFGHLQRLSLDFFGRNRSGVILSRLTSDIDALAALFQEGFVNLVVQGFSVIAVTTVLFLLSPTLAGLLLLVIVPVFVGLTWWFRSASAVAYSRTRDRIAEVLADLSEHLGGIRAVIASDRGRRNTEQHAHIVGRYRDANVDATRIGTIYGPAAEVTGLVGQALVLLVGGRLVLDGRLSIGELTAFVLYLTTFFAPIQQLVQLYNTYQQGNAAMNKLRALQAEEPSVVESPDAIALPAIDGEIELSGVRFGYRSTAPLGTDTPTDPTTEPDALGTDTPTDPTTEPDALGTDTPTDPTTEPDALGTDTPTDPTTEPEALVLSGIDLRIAAGETVALVGPSGAGKTTIARLIARFYDPIDGRVTVDGYDLRDVTLRSLRSQLGVVPQEPFLFHGTLRDNLAFGRPDASDDDIVDVCAAVGLSSLLDRGQGLATPVHERGVSISAGERQLIALARALLARPRVLILDEATSNLDLESESQVEAALDLVLEGRTAVLIAHRLATARRADRIIVVDDGGIAEMGSHDELLAIGDRYAEMYRHWVAAGGR